MKLKNIYFFLLISCCLACQEKLKHNKSTDPQIINFDNKEVYKNFSRLNLDEKCENLLDLKNVSENERKKVINSWSSFHRKVTKFLKTENFEWNIQDASISIYNRIYFDMNGKIKYYVFNINNPSISKSKKEEFEKILLKFSKEIQLGITRENAFSQCGKTIYKNDEV